MMALTIAVKITLAVILCAISLSGHLVKADDTECFHFVNTTGGIITSPNYPEQYPSSVECIWQLESAPGGKIKLVFEFMDLEGFDDCFTDSVRVHDGNSTKSNLLGIFCGNKIPSPVISTSNKMLVLFESNYEGQFQGFKATYTKVPANKRPISERVRTIPGLLDIESNLTEYFMTTRLQGIWSINKWGAPITKTAIALFLNDLDQVFFSPGSRYGEEIVYELSLQLLSKLSLNKKIPTKDLALYINALIAVCIDPKDFFGTNLVNELRTRVNNSNYTNPFSVLTLCNAKDNMTKDDVRKLQQIYDAHFRPVWTDTQAMVVMALSCIHFESGLNLDQTILDEMVAGLKRKQHKNGSVDNLKTTALVVQALIAANNYENGFDMIAAINFVVREVRRTYPNTQDIYYILPILNLRSFANISFNHCAIHVETDLHVMSNLHEYLDTRIQVQVSVVIGNDMDFTRTWKMKVPSNYSFYQVLENISRLEPSYQVQYSISEGKPYVVGLANFQDDIEVGKFWFTYSKPLLSTGNPKPILQSPVDIPVDGSEELILWYRSGSWVNSDLDSLD